MFEKMVTAFALSTPNVGEQNQIKGLFAWMVKGCRKRPLACFAFNWDMFVQSVNGHSLRLSDYADYQDFEADVFSCLDAYFSRHLWTPRIFVTAYTQGENEKAAPNADASCQAIKAYYQQRRLGTVITVIMTAGAYDYQWADIVNIPRHMVDDDMRKALEQKPEKFFASIGIIHNMTKTFIRQKFGQKRLQKVVGLLAPDRPNIVFCLGGRTNGDDIVFSLQNAAKIWEKAVALERKGYNVVFVNGHRTPDDVCDYFYEQSLKHGKIRFFNAKRIAADDVERISGNWRIYSGKYMEDFYRQQKEYGNVYPGILGLKNTLAVHTFDSFASCETASSGVPTAICRDVDINRQTRPDCYRLAEQLIGGGYAVDFADFDGNTEPLLLNLKKLPSVNKLFADKVAEFICKK
uniref:Uncharacterized protein n=1 Tax=uncultured Alphaproteobacteria bacterium TaxID=91750 RepID=A0A6G8F2H4_9PROT|nr:hypothetical protein PlAlph_1360 [uncultured Alphaproteobacteria bacterium]